MDMPIDDEWVLQCVQRIGEADPQMDAQEALQLARDLRRFERTAAMTPVAAVEFVVREMARPGGRFERRTKPRGPGAA